MKIAYVAASVALMGALAACGGNDHEGPYDRPQLPGDNPSIPQDSGPKVDPITTPDDTGGGGLINLKEEAETASEPEA